MNDFDHHTDARLRVAEAASTFSNCTRLHVGCALYSDSQFIASDHNGQDGDCTGAVGACGCTHAEDRALQGAETGIDPVTHVYITHQPCAQCARTLIALGTVRVVRWMYPYRLTEGADLLRAAGIDAQHWT